LPFATRALHASLAYSHSQHQFFLSKRRRKEKKSLRFSAIIMGASYGGNPELFPE
jgi:hypothetical protein